MEGTTHNPIAIESDIEILQHERIGDSQAAANVTGAKSKKKPTKKRKTDSNVYFNHCNRSNVSQDQWRVLVSKFNNATQIIPPLGVEQLRNKFDSLYKRYKAEKHKQSQTGTEPSSWELYEQMHRIKGDSPKEQGIPGACDGRVHLRPPIETDNIGLTDEVHDFTDEVFSGSFMEAMGSDVEREIPAAKGFVTSPGETPVQTPPTICWLRLVSPRSNYIIARATSALFSKYMASLSNTEGDQSATSPRTKARSQPRVVGQKNKKRRASKDNDDGMKTCMLEFTQVVKEANERKSAQKDRKFDFMVTQEQGKMNLMSQILELKRMELDILRNNQRGPPPS
ncbi:hypothetical protein R1sor_008529 [Riccia sorocarpa]|uniref:Myb/SANT-like DNA-binding domain-containing protein n=1 Tax=Riccia sorocarpa TaxID=122646 RepID=A0ABD3HTN7_9MARC